MGRVAVLVDSFPFKEIVNYFKVYMLFKKVIVIFAVQDMIENGIAILFLENNFFM